MGHPGRGRRGPGGLARRAAPPGRPGPHAPLTRLEIAAAVAAGSRRAPGQRHWLDLLERDEQLAGLRADRQSSIRRAARVLARRASWTQRTVRPVICCAACRAGGDCRGVQWPCLRRAARIALSTWRMARRWLEEHGYLGTVRGGYVWAWQHTVLSGAEEAPNDAAVYVLTEPVAAGQRRTRPLTAVRRTVVHTHARERAVDSPGATPGSDGGAAAAVIRHLRAQLAVLGRGPARRLSDRYLLALGRPMLAAGWSPADLAHAIGHDPVAGRRHQAPASGVASPAAWLAWRLSRWMRDPDAAWAAWHRLGRWDWSGDPATWPVPGLSPSARVAAAASAASRRLRAVLPHRPGAAPTAGYLAARSALPTPRRRP